ncbi:MAG: type I polyketide synthase, partial [Candidatus Hydrogenedentes bacterium]|nr:type I polyketide synthase [Candidatus Hydrogenedentota bacterium]
MTFDPIAIVGIGGVFPGAPDLNTFWRNIAARAYAGSDVPDGRWPLPFEAVYSPEIGALDHTYSTRGCFVEDGGLALDLAAGNLGDDLASGALFIEQELLGQLDPMFRLAFFAGQHAFRDARAQRWNRDRIGVILGNIALPTESASKLAWEYLGRTFQEKMTGQAGPAKLVHPLNRFVAGLPAGLLAKALRLGGTAHTLDAACASSLYALKLACDELQSGRADAMLAGGLSRPDCLYTQMGFSQLRALSPTGVSAPFDRAANGLVV